MSNIPASPRHEPATPLPVADILVGERLRAVDEDYVALLAVSIEEIGLMHPIEVGPADKRGNYPLIAGAHRLAAFQSQGWLEVPAIVMSAKGLDAKLREIDENLMRRELTPLDRATFLAQRKEIHEAKHPHTKHGGDRKSDQVDKLGHLIGSFSQEVADKLDISERSVRRAIHRHSRIAPDVRAQIGTTWIATKGAMLDALAKEPPEDQRRIVAELLAETNPAKTVGAALERIRGASIMDVISEDEKQVNALMKAWRNAGQRARDRFVEYLNGQSAEKAKAAKQSEAA